MFMYCHATICFILILVPCLWYYWFPIIYYAWQTLRGRWTLFASMFPLALLCHYLRLLPSRFLLTYVYHLTSIVLSPDHSSCYHLVRPLCRTMTYPDYHLSPDLTGYLIYITTYHAISWHQVWYTDSYNYHDKGNVVPDYCYVLITVMYYCYDMTHSRTLIIMLISYKMDNLYGYGRKWWMPEWYLAYSDGIKVYIYIDIDIYIYWR